MGSSPLVFTGITSFSNDFQTILSRAVSIASLPLKKLQNEQADLAQKKQLLVSLNGSVADLGSSIASLATLAQNKALSATSSNPAKVSVVNSGATSGGTYAISNITSIATAASETSTSGYASSSTTAVSADGSLSLVIGAQSYPILLSAAKNNLVGLRDAINGLGVGVTASVITTGTGANPNYLSISANTTGATTLAVNDVPTVGSPVNLVTATNQGTNAVFQLNGLPVSRASNSVNDVVPGLTFNILDKTAASEVINLTLNTDRSQLTGALQTFSSRYNALVDAADSQIGPAGGLLTGDFLIRQIESDLRQVTSSSQGSGSVKSLSDLGLSLDAKGKITVDPTVTAAFSDTQVADSFKFLGTSTTGFGALASKFTQLSDPASGLIGLQEGDYTRRNDEVAHQVNLLNDRITRLQASIAARLQVADTLIAQLQSQQQVLTASLQAVNLVTYGKNTSTSSSGN
ncbi:MAG: flagellar filament capping protein FliD [Acidobacteriota bacterium]|nr:flagellar filament capping protein FliD [Acidobacteriota bacterium]